MSNENRKPMYIDITQPEKFEKIASTALETTQKLAKRINKLFSSAFVDYYGAIIYCTPGNGNVAPNQLFNVEIHFKPLTAGSVAPNDDRVRAFKPIEEGKASDDIVANLKNIYGSFRTSAKFQITDEAAEILSEFMLPGTNVDPFKPSTYDQYKAEYIDNQRYGQSPVMIKLANLDLSRLIRKIYGSKNADGQRVDYGIIPYGPVNPNTNMNNMVVQSNANWRVIIMQIEAEKTYDLASEFGLFANNGSVAPIVTGTV